MSRLTRAVAIRPGEGRLVMLVAGAFAAVDAGRDLGGVGVDTLVLTRFDADILPRLFIGLGLVGVIVTLGYGAALTGSTSERFFPALLVVMAAVLGVEWLLALSGVEAIIPIVWISVNAAGLLLLTVMWTIAGFTFDARQAKRLFPLLTSAAIVGSLSGSLMAIVIQRLLGAEALILVEALLFVLAAALLRGLGARVRPRRAPGEPRPSVVGALTSGASYVAASPLMRLVAVAYVLLAVLLFSVTFPFLAAMRAAYPDESELLTVLALLSAAVTVASFLTGTLLANRLFARLGVATVALALPAVYLLGFGLWVVRFGLATALVVRFAQQVIQRGVSNAAWSAFYNVIPSRRRGQVLAFMDGVPGQLGTMISGVLLILATSMAIEQVFLLGLVTAIACLVVGLLIRRAYAASLVATLRAGRAEQVLEGGPGLEALARDRRVIAELREATRSDRAPERLLAADLLARLETREAVPDLERLGADEDAAVRRVAIGGLARLAGPAARAQLHHALDDDDPRVRVTALSALAGSPPEDGLPAEVGARLRADTSPAVRGELAVALGRWDRRGEAAALIEALLGADDPSARAAGLDALARLDGTITAAALEAHLADPAPIVRAAALRAVAIQDGGDTGAVVRALDDPARQVRLTAAAILRERPRTGEALLEVLAAGSGRARESALVALEGHADEPGVRRALVAWAQDQVRRATRLRGHAQALAVADDGSTAAFLGQVIARRSRAIEAGLLQALAILGAPEASGLIRRCLHSVDPEVRAQAIEALDALGDPRLTRAVVRLLDQGSPPDGAATRDLLDSAAELADDDDAWVRALALRTLSERLGDEQQQAILDRAQADPDPVVRGAVEVTQGDAAMPERMPLVNDIDRMLFLRRVPIFAALDPEDLQRVAASAVERSWAADDILMGEGELSGELVVIVEGAVRVVHLDEEHVHVLRRYEVGDHIGELGVLREAPRSATVIAEEGGVRGLVISGEAVASLLRERPEAAMAMLATLAERISQQG